MILGPSLHLRRLPSNKLNSHIWLVQAIHITPMPLFNANIFPMLKYILFCGKIPQERNNTLLTISFIDKDLESNNKNNNREVYRVLYQKFFDWLLKWLNLWFKLRSFIDSDCSCYDRARHSTCSTKSLLGTNKYIRHILKSKNEASCYCFFNFHFLSNPLHTNISLHILYTDLYTVP